MVAAERASGDTPLRGVLTDWGGVLTVPIKAAVRAWLDADDIDRSGYEVVMRSWLGRAYATDDSGERKAGAADGAPGAGDARGIGSANGTAGPGWPAVLVNPVHALERGETAPADFERLLASQLVRVDGAAVPSAGLLRRMFTQMRPVESMYKLLRSLREAGIATGVVSNSWGNDYPRERFAEVFDAVIISSEVGMRKPEARIFWLALGRLGLTPGECVFIDDVEANVLAAEALGMVALHHREPEITAAAVLDLFGFV